MIEVSLHGTATGRLMWHRWKGIKLSKKIINVSKCKVEFIKDQTRE